MASDNSNLLTRNYRDRISGYFGSTESLESLADNIEDQGRLMNFCTFESLPMYTKVIVQARNKNFAEIVNIVDAINNSDCKATAREILRNKNLQKIIVLSYVNCANLQNERKHLWESMATLMNGMNLIQCSMAEKIFVQEIEALTADICCNQENILRIAKHIYELWIEDGNLSYGVALEKLEGLVSLSQNDYNVQEAVKEYQTLIRVSQAMSLLYKQDYEMSVELLDKAFSYASNSCTWMTDFIFDLKKNALLRLKNRALKTHEEELIETFGQVINRFKDNFSIVSEKVVLFITKVTRIFLETFPSSKQLYVSFKQLLHIFERKIPVKPARELNNAVNSKFCCTKIINSGEFLNSQLNQTIVYCVYNESSEKQKSGNRLQDEVSNIGYLLPAKCEPHANTYRDWLRLSIIFDLFRCNSVSD